MARDRAQQPDAMVLATTRRTVLSIILVRRDEGGYYGANGWESNHSDRGRYERGE